MWMSMTGFGRGDHHGEDVSVIAEARTVNHRFLDIHVRCPVKFLSWERRIRSLVRGVVRGGGARGGALGARGGGGASCPRHARRVETGGGRAAAFRHRAVGPEPSGPNGRDRLSCRREPGTCQVAVPGADRGPVGGGGGGGPRGRRAYGNGWSPRRRSWKRSGNRSRTWSDPWRKGMSSSFRLRRVRGRPPSAGCSPNGWRTFNFQYPTPHAPGRRGRWTAKTNISLNRK